MGSDHVFHIDHVDRKTMQARLGLEYATVANATGLMLAQPPFSDTLLTSLFEFPPAITAYTMLAVEPVL